MRRARLSIVLPVVNEAVLIRSQLLKLQPLRERGTEIIVVDGGSEDGTAGQLRGVADKVINAPRGRATQMNVGAQSSSGDVLLFLHADTSLPRKADVKILEVVRDGARWGRFDVRIDDSHPLLRVVESMMNFRSRWTGIATGDQAIFVRRDFFNDIGGFPEIPLMEDIAISRMLKRIAAPHCLRDIVVTSGRRWRKDGVMRTIVLMWRLRAAYFLGADPKELAVRYGYIPKRS